MAMRSWLAAGLLAALALTLGCSQADKAGAKGGAEVTPAAAGKYVLKAEPAGAKGVIEAKKAVKDNDEVALVGRIGGSERPFEEEIAAFTIVDSALKPCEDGCPTPWDYCCANELKSGIATVKVVDAGGKPVMGNPRQLLGLKELATVVVHGKAKRDDAGNLTVLADGLYVRP